MIKPKQVSKRAKLMLKNNQLPRWDQGILSLDTRGGGFISGISEAMAFNIDAKSSLTIRATLDRAFQGNRLLIEIYNPEGAHDFQHATLDSFYINTESVLAVTGPIPTAMFNPLAVGMTIVLPVTHKSDTIRIKLSNRAPYKLTGKCVIIGSYRAGD